MLPDGSRRICTILDAFSGFGSVLLSQVLCGISRTADWDLDPDGLDRVLSGMWNVNVALG